MLARNSIARRLSYFSAAPKRYTSSRIEGSVAQSKGFRYVLLVGCILDAA
jgi:hypothetical protein